MTQSSAPHKQRRRWPITAEWARVAAMDAAEQARALLRSSMARTMRARDALARNPRDEKAGTDLADAVAEQAQALALLADIQRFLAEARQGRED